MVFYINQMNKRNTLDQRFINLREVFHDFQTSVRFSTSNSNTQIFANHLKCYEFLGELEEHFIAENVSHLYEFIHSIFSLIFTMVRQGPSNKNQKQIQTTENVFKCDMGVQTQIIDQQSNKKIKVQQNNNFNSRHKKRSCLQIQIFEKDLTEMDFRQRRRMLRKMRDVIYASDQVNQANQFLKQFKPNIQKISYSKSDQSIKAAIDKFKQSDISTHIFLKHFMNEFIQIKDIKCYQQLLNKDVLQHMSKTVNTYKNVKIKQKQKLKPFSHIVEQIVYPSLKENNNFNYLISINNINMKSSSINQNNKDQTSQPNKTGQKMMKLNFNHKKNAKRSKFPSLLLSPSDSLNLVSQQKSQHSIQSQTSQKSIISRKQIETKNRKRIKSKNRLSLSPQMSLSKIFKRKSISNLTPSKNLIQSIEKQRKDKQKLLNSRIRKLSDKQDNQISLKRIFRQSQHSVTKQNMNNIKVQQYIVKSKNKKLRKKGLSQFVNNQDIKFRSSFHVV